MKNYNVHIRGEILEVIAKKFVINESMRVVLFKGTEEDDEAFVGLFSLDTIYGFEEFDV